MTMAYPRWLINQHGPRQTHHQYLICSWQTSLIWSIEWKLSPAFQTMIYHFLDISIRVRLNKKTPRKIHLYHKGNIDGLTASLSNFSEGFCERYESQESWDVEAMWISFKVAVLHAIDTHIPTKQITSKKQSLPWITQWIKKAIRKRDTLNSNEHRKTIVPRIENYTPPRELQSRLL